MSFLGKWQTIALDGTCTITTGGAVSGGGTSYADVACMEVPPTEYQDDTMLKLLVIDTDEVYVVGSRVVYDSTRYLVERTQQDGTYTILLLKSWPESLS